MKYLFEIIDALMPIIYIFIIVWIYSKIKEYFEKSNENHKMLIEINKKLDKLLERKEN